MRRTDETQIWDLIQEATVDCHDREEQVTGLHTMLEEHLELPFQTVVLGLPVIVDSVDLDEFGDIVGTCTSGKFQQKISLCHLPLPKPPPTGSEWIKAYCHWAQHARW